VWSRSRRTPASSSSRWTSPASTRSRSLPAISIEQKTTSKNPRSTVGTVTEIYDYFRLLFARIGRPVCHRCGRAITAQTVSQMVDATMAFREGARVQVLAPIVRGRKGEYRKELTQLAQKGFVRARVDGKWVELDDVVALDKQKKHTIELVVDRLVVKPGIERRLADSIEAALPLGEGVAIVNVDGKTDHLFSERLACIECGVSYPEIAPRVFSFNSPHGACPSATASAPRGSSTPPDRPQPRLSRARAPCGRGAPPRPTAPR
jgi:excinuclease ABC subunit A